MADYPTPTLPIPPEFNPSTFQVNPSAGISVGFADSRYLKLNGGTETGPVIFQSSTTFQNSSTYTANNTSLAFSGTGQQILAGSGSLTIPSISFYSNSNTGIYLPSANIIAMVCNGIEELRISASLITSSNPINLPSGSNTAPAVQVGATGVGLYSSAANTLNFATNSTNQLAISTTAITSTLPIACPSTTTITNCGLQVGLANTGLQYNGGVLYFGLGGTQMMRYQAAQIYSSVPHNFTNGSAATPSLTAASYQTTGLYWSAGPTLNITAGGVQRANITGTSLQLNGVPLDANGNNVQNAPQVGNAAGNLELRMNSTGAGGTFTITGGTGLLSGTAGGSSGQHLALTINGVSYKIALLLP